MATSYTPLQRDMELPYALQPPLPEAGFQGVGVQGLPGEHLLQHVTSRHLGYALAGTTLLAFLSQGFLLAQGVQVNVVTTVLLAVITYFLGKWSLRGTWPGMLTTAFVGLVLFPTPFFRDVFTPLFMVFMAAALLKGLQQRLRGGNFLRSSGSEVGLATREESLRSTWGVAGGHVARNKAFGTAGQVGAEGEVKVGQALRSLTDRYPFVRVFHGVRFTPGKEGPDIDHVVLVGNKVFFVDAKNWLVSSYTWAAGEVLRQGTSFAGGDVHMDAAMEKWLPLLQGVAPVTSRIALSKEETSSYRYHLDNRGAPRGVALVTLPDLMAELESTAAATPPLVNRRLVYLFAQELNRS